MRLTATSFTHASTATFAVAVVGYAAVRLVSFAAPYAAPHLPGHHGSAAHPQPRVAAIRQDPARASRSAHRAAAPTQRAVRDAPAATTEPKDRSHRRHVRADDATAAPLERAVRWRQIDVEPPADPRNFVEWQNREQQAELHPTDEAEGWSQPTPTPAVAGPDDTAPTPTTQPTEPTDDEADEPHDN